MIYNMIKPLLDVNTRTKVKILGSDYHKSLLEVTFGLPNIFFSLLPLSALSELSLLYR